jgi:hypothetical protein
MRKKALHDRQAGNNVHDVKAVEETGDLQAIKVCTELSGGVSIRLAPIMHFSCTKHFFPSIFI